MFWAENAHYWEKSPKATKTSQETFFILQITCFGLFKSFKYVFNSTSGHISSSQGPKRDHSGRYNCCGQHLSMIFISKDHTFVINYCLFWIENTMLGSTMMMMMKNLSGSVQCIVGAEWKAAAVGEKLFKAVCPSDPLFWGTVYANLT